MTLPSKNRSRKSFTNIRQSDLRMFQNKKGIGPRIKKDLAQPAPATRRKCIIKDMRI